jgi:hypothetical protein
MQRTLLGEFRLDASTEGVWRIERLSPSGESLWLRGVETQGLSIPTRLDGLTIDWQTDGRVLFTLGAGTESVTLRAASALLHEPRERLYDSLPLPRYTAQTARFWRRVFGLVRIPGGRLLLGLLARRSRRSS